MAGEGETKLSCRIESFGTVCLQLNVWLHV